MDLTNSLVPSRFLIKEKNGLIQDIYTDHLLIEQARKGTWGGRASYPSTLAQTRFCLLTSRQLTWLNQHLLVLQQLIKKSVQNMS